MIFESHAPVQFDRRIAMVYFEVNDRNPQLLRFLSEEFEGLAADAESPVAGANKKFVYPGVAAAVLKTIVKSHDDITHIRAVDCDEPDTAKLRIGQKVFSYPCGGYFIEGAGPGIIRL